MKKKMILIIAILLVVLMALTPLITVYLMQEKIGKNFTAKEQQELVSDIKKIKNRMDIHE